METETKLPLYRAIELRAEMDARIKTLESLRPEREERRLLFRRLIIAIHEANHQTSVEFRHEK